MSVSLLQVVAGAGVMTRSRSAGGAVGGGVGGGASSYHESDGDLEMYDSNDEEHVALRNQSNTKKRERDE